MELRSQPRLETTEPVHVTVLGESETKFLGRIVNYSSRGLGLLADHPAPQGAAAWTWSMPSITERNLPG
jgi:hypothetical protein